RAVQRRAFERRVRAGPAGGMDRRVERAACAGDDRGGLSEDPQGLRSPSRRRFVGLSMPHPLVLAQHLLPQALIGRIVYRAARAGSPVDGRLTEFGQARAGQLRQAKGFEYALEELTGEGPADLRLFANGAYATIYLAPHDYHRVHMPLAGKLTATRYIPGRRF